METHDWFQSVVISCKDQRAQSTRQKSDNGIADDSFSPVEDNISLGGETDENVPFDWHHQNEDTLRVMGDKLRYQPGSFSFPKGAPEVTA